MTATRPAVARRSSGRSSARRRRARKRARRDGQRHRTRTSAEAAPAASACRATNPVERRATSSCSEWKAARADPSPRDAVRSASSRASRMRRTSSLSITRYLRDGPSFCGKSLRCHPQPPSAEAPDNCKIRSWWSLSTGRWAMVRHAMPSSLVISKSLLSRPFPTALVHSSRMAKRGRWYSSRPMLSACCSPNESKISQSMSAPSPPGSRETASAPMARSARCSRST
mmetsp:Transcript_32291/g.106569  ORF Transcript_32291/g.106569 Transcript_32291/m.106569 type:complete len:227 (+) Transcript_32291:2075-2755(+)